MRTAAGISFRKLISGLTVMRTRCGNMDSECQGHDTTRCDLGGYVSETSCLELLMVKPILCAQSDERFETNVYQILTASMRADAQIKSQYRVSSP